MKNLIKTVLFIIFFIVFNLTAYSMQIFIKLPSGQTITLDVEATDSIQNVKQKIENLKGYPSDIQLLYFEGDLLENNLTLGDYNIQKESTLILHLAQGIPTMPEWSMIILGLSTVTLLVVYLRKMNLLY